VRAKSLTFFIVTPEWSKISAVLFFGIRFLQFDRLLPFSQRSPLANLFHRFTSHADLSPLAGGCRYGNAGMISAHKAAPVSIPGMLARFPGRFAREEI
jgi:hypothetical protein